MIKFTYDNGTVEPFTLILSTRDYNHLGEIVNIDHNSFNYTGKLNSADEMSFEVYKEVDGYVEKLWDDIFDLRLVYVKELNQYFEINVSLTDKVYMTKTITATSLCECELSQVYLHDIEINTADDIAREDYDANYPTYFYRDLQHEIPGTAQYEKLRTSSLMHRILEKVPAYSIKHVDASLASLMREFSISDSTIYDFLTGECAEQFNCLFQFDSTDRTISVYDLFSYCKNNQCAYYLNENKAYYKGSRHLRYRNDFSDFCPICGSTNISYYGTDTTVFVSTENLTDEVKFETDVGSIKNCFRLEAGDDNMTAAVININPNGSQYIYEFSKESRDDMPDELIELMSAYDVEYEYQNNQVPISIDSTIRNKYNTLCKKYNEDSVYHNGNDTWSTIPSTIYGYTHLMPYYYECVDFYSYLKSSMMPPVTIEGTTVKKEATKLNNATDLLTLGVSSLTESTSLATINSAMLAYAKVFINTGFIRLSVDTKYSNSFSYSSKKWYGRFKLENYEDDTDVAYSNYFTVEITTDYATFMKEKIRKQLLRNGDDDYSIYGVVSKSISDFKKNLKLWSAVRLESFHDAIEAVLGILIDAGQGVDGAQLKEDFYDDYYKKAQLCQKELDLRNSEIATIWGNYNDDGMVIDKGTVQYIVKEIREIQDALNFKKFIYNNTYPHSYHLYNVYTTYVREDTYSNSNFISDNLTNEQLFDNARSFMERAKEALHQSATYQHSIKSNLNNLLAIDEFKPIISKFELGNWIRVQIDETVYRLRLISYSINFGELQKINTEFSDVTITSNGLSDVNSILKQASSMASSYDYVEQQAENAALIQSTYIDDWVENGLNSALIKINNNNDEDIKIDSAGITARTYDDVLDEYDPKQLRITHNVMAFTDDNWSSVKTALGSFEFKHHIPLVNDNTTIVTEEKYGLVAEAVLAGNIVGSHIESSDMISGHIQNIGNSSYMDLTNIDDGDTQSYFLKCENNFLVDKAGKVTSRSGRFEKDSNYYIDLSGEADYLHFSSNFSVDKTGIVSSKAGVFKMDEYNYINLSGKDDYLHFSDLSNNPLFRVDKFGHLFCKDASIEGLIEASTVKGTTIEGSTITGTLIEGNTINGGTITGTLIEGTTINGTTINGGTINGTDVIGGTLQNGNLTNGLSLVIKDGLLKGYNNGEEVGSLRWDGYIGEDDITGFELRAEGILQLNGKKGIGFSDGKAVWIGQTGSLNYISDITINDNGSVNWNTSSLYFMKGLMVTSLEGDFDASPGGSGGSSGSGGSGGSASGGTSTYMKVKCVTVLPTSFEQNTIYLVRK